MVVPVYAYGHPVLKKVCVDIDKDYPDLEKLVENMWDTMYFSKGVGLAGPQVGHAIRLFVVDTQQTLDEKEVDKGIKKVFINAEIIEDGGDLVAYEEGCLSIPNIHADVVRPEYIIMEYYDENFEKHTEKFDGINARVIQHEYDHTEGILFTELIKPIRRKMVKKKLENIRKGKIIAEYKLKFSTTAKIR